MAATAAPRQTHREGAGERLAEFVVLAGMVLVAVAGVLPLLLVAGPVFLALYALRTRARLKWALPCSVCCPRRWASWWPT